jgi:formylglycine-generating enzyme required for sulfatase activity
MKTKWNIVMGVIGMFLWAVPGWAECPNMDLTGDCFVNLEDFAVLAGQWLTGNPLPSDFVSIPGGTFQMGDSIGDGWVDDRPVHMVTLDPFAMGKYEITNGQYCAFLNAAYPSQLKVVNDKVYASSDIGASFPYCGTSPTESWSHIAFSNNSFSVLTKGGRDMSNDPMNCVSWYGAAAYCNWRSRQEGRQICYDLSNWWTCDFRKRGYRLPTEAEWEYAARGRLYGQRFPWGNTITHSQANYSSSSSYPYDISPTRNSHPVWNDGIYPYTAPVGSFPPNGFGLYDTAGNICEWCNDWFGGYSTIPQTNPTGPATGPWRIVRGGDFYEDAMYSHVSGRSAYYIERWLGLLGFRVVLIVNGNPGGHWPLDGSYLSSVPEYVGMPIGDPDFVPEAEARIGTGALDLDGDDAVVINGFSGILGTAARTCTAWIKTTATVAPIVYWGDVNATAGGMWDMRVNGLGQLRVQLGGGGAATGATLVNTGQWVHVATVLPEGGSSAAEVQLYVNGVRETAVITAGVINTVNKTPMRIGTNEMGQYFTGLIDDVRVYDRALTAEEIAALANP